MSVIVCECDRESPTGNSSWPTGGCCALEKDNLPSTVGVLISHFCCLPQQATVRGNSEVCHPRCVLKTNGKVNSHRKRSKA